ncbi:MAG: hypothetical protein KME16_26980 [Scytolyngbya sp. HA4215-MV1]|nr:hypothetical protein [Scytolyngbya sp. HA4215-MV1]
MRYSFWTGRPRNVSRREYNAYAAMAFGAVATGGLAFLLALSAAIGMPTWTAQSLARLESMSVQAAANYRGDRRDLVKLQGYLITDHPPRMPDQASLRVIRGKLNVQIKETQTSQAPLRETLWQWEQSAQPIDLSDGKHQVRLGFDFAALPLPEAPPETLPQIHRDGVGRFAKPIEVEYGGRHFPLDPNKWGKASSVSTEVERQVLPYGQAVVIVAGLESTPKGSQLVDPLGDRLQVLVGTEAEIRQNGERTRILFGGLSVPMALASAVLGRSARRRYQRLVEISNQT